VGCVLEPNEWDGKMVNEAGSGENYDPEEHISEEVEREIEKEVERCLEDKVQDIKESMNEGFNDKIDRENYTLTDLEKLDLETWAGEKEHKEMWKCGKELGMSPIEIISTPEIVGSKGVEDMEGKIRDTMEALRNLKGPPDFREEHRVNKIMFIDPEQTGIKVNPREIANAWRQEKLRENLELLRTIHIFRKDGQFPQGKELQKTLAHEIYHYNYPLISDRLAYHAEEWKRACHAQIEKVGPVSRYAGEYEERGYSKEDVDQDEEFQAEHFSFWATDSLGLCPEMKSFFDKYFSE